MRISPSGEQWTIRAGDACATVVEVGGGLRQYRRGDVDVLDPFAIDAMCDGAHNMPLVPWPNRIKDGRYRFDDTDYQLPLTEPALHNAIHGFGRWRNWTLREQEPHRVVVGLVFHPQKGYPFTLDVAIEYALGDDGLAACVTATNLGDTACPYAFGQHVYLACDTRNVDDFELQLEANQWLPIDARQIPVGVEPVDASGYDFRAGREVGRQKLDTTFTGLVRDPDGRAWARLRSPTGRLTSLWADEHCRYMQLFTGDTLAPERRRCSIAVEPMTAAPNAFAGGECVIRLEPGEVATVRWGVVGG